MNYRKIPIGFCPSCHRTVVYSNDGREKKDVRVILVEEDYNGKSQLCSKCKTMYAIIEKPKVVRGYVELPIIKYKNYCLK